MNKKILMLLVILGSVWLLLTLTGCSVIESEANEEARFIHLGYDHSSNFSIYYDKITKVQYIFRSDFRWGAAMTVLLDSDGKPLLYEGGE